jgi:hypothetical protein
MTWYAEPHISGNPGIQYAPGYTSNESMKKYDSFYAQVTNLSEDIEAQKFISVTTILTVITSGIENGTNITCLTYRGGHPLVSSSILYFADLPHWKNTSVICPENNTAVVELGYMFDGGGVPIDHYIIQVDNGTQLETPGPTYSFDIMYNTTLSVNISAHNCAGYSDLFPLEIQYDQDLELQCKQGGV